MQNMEKRKFKRYDLGIRAYVQTRVVGEAGHAESVWLCDLSGEGTLFNTASPDWYIPGEQVGLTICMPGAPGVHAIMQTHGIVSRVEAAIREAGRSAAKSCVALQFLEPLQFDRSEDGVPAVCQ